MAFLDIDVSRFKYLLNLGTDDVELRRFFKDCRLQLIMQGARVQNLPHGPLARIQVLASELPSRADRVIRQWFAKHITMIDPDPVDVVVGAFEVHEQGGEQVAEELARRYSRSCLVHLFSDTPADELLIFLRTPIGMLPDEEFHPASDEAIVELETTESYPRNLPAVLLDLVDGKEVQEHLDGLPHALAAFVSGVRAVTIGNVGDTREALEELDDDPSLRTCLEQFAQQREARKIARDQAPTGLEVVELSEYRDSYDPDADAVLAYCTNDRPNAVFVRPIAVVRENQIEELRDDKRKELFPDTGDVIVFVGPKHPKAPRRGQIGVWQVAEHPTEKHTHFHLSAERRMVFEMRPVPFASTEYDSVREFLKGEWERAGAGWLQPPLFLLQDGVIIGGRLERPDLTKDQTFESDLVRWNSLRAFPLEGRLFVLGPIRKPDGIYECASLAFTVRKLFKGAPDSADGLGRKLTKAQLRELIQSMDGYGANLDALRVQRVKSELARLGDLHEALEALVATVMNHEEVKRRVDKLVEERAAAVVLSKESLRGDIQKLQRQRADLDLAIQRQQLEQRKVREDTIRVVKDAFEKARKGGLATLAEVAVFQALSEGSAHRHSPDATPAKAGGPSIRSVARSTDDAAAVFRSFGIPPQRTAALVALADCAIRSGIMVGVKGLASRVVVGAWAGTFGSPGVFVDATVGLISDAAIREVCEDESQPNVIALLDSNLSALDIYARPLLDLVFWRVVRKGDAGPAVLFSINDGVGSLPLPSGFERLSVVVDLDASGKLLEPSALDDLRSRILDASGGSLYQELWRPAADRMCLEIQRLEPAGQVLVLSALDRARSSL